MKAFCWRTVKARGKDLGLLFAVGLFVVACSRTNATPTASAQTTIAPAAIAATAESTPAQSPTVDFLPTVTSTPPFAAGASTVEAPGAAPGSATGIASQGAIFTSPRYSYTVVLPCCWLALPTPGTAMETALAEMEAEGDTPLWGDLGERVRERETGAVLELIALLPDEENVATPAAQVTVSVLPTNGLTLDDYLVATADELNSIANTKVISAYVEATLGVGALPASVIEYRAVPMPASTENSEQTMAGLQVAFFGQDAETLIVLTFTTTTDRFDELKPEFLHIVRTVTLSDPAV